MPQSHALTHRRSLAEWIPFGLGQIKPKHFREMLGVVWKNRDNLRHGFRVITEGVCDGCALGAAGMHDWNSAGPHVCMTRFALLRRNTMPALDHGLLADVSALEKLRHHELGELGRLAYPMLRERGAQGFRRISWDDANARIARCIRATRPESVAFVIAARRATNETFYMAQKAARFLGTNHIDHADRLRHGASGAAMQRTLGIAGSTCSFQDWYRTDLLVFFGSNPANDQPVAMQYLREAKRLGTKVVMVNPLLEPGMKRYWVPSAAGSALFGTDIADYWFPVGQGGEIAFIYGVLKVAIGHGWLDEAFLRERCTGWEVLKAEIQKHKIENLEIGSGLARSTMLEFANLMHCAKTGVFVWGAGITQHPHGADGVQMILNLALTRGWVGRDKTGVMPLSDEVSTQGAAEMGAGSSMFPSAKPVNAANAAALSREYGFEVPAWPGMSAVDMLDACGRGEIDVLYNLGGNFLRALPGPAQVARSMANVPLRVHQDIILTGQMLIEAREEVILLPAKTRYEQDDGGTATSTERRVIFSPELPRKVGECRAEWKILRDIAIAAHPERAHLLGCETGWRIREEIARVVPLYDGVQHLRKISDAFQYAGAHLCAGGVFPTGDGMAHLSAPPVPAGPAKDLFRVGIRRGYEFDALVYAGTDPLTGADRDAIFMADADAGRLGLENGERIALVNAHGRYEGRVFLADLAPGNLQVMWSEANAIIPRGAVPGRGGAPDFYADVRVEPAS